MHTDIAWQPPWPDGGLVVPPCPPVPPVLELPPFPPGLAPPPLFRLELLHARPTKHAKSVAATAVGISTTALMRRLQSRSFMAQEDSTAIRVQIMALLYAFA